MEWEELGLDCNEGEATMVALRLGAACTLVLLYFVMSVSSDYCNLFGTRTPCGEWKKA